MSFLDDLRTKRQKFLDGLKANDDDISMDLFDDFYPDKAHFIYELLQNAEDAEATEVNFNLSNCYLTFEHNGRPFDDKDVRAITGIGFSPKKEDVDKIGQFGIGFKAVFLYTASPRIWSPTYAFEISDMVLPSPLPESAALGNRTCFEFPFNSVKKTRSLAFSEVRDGLEEISDKTLLFLSHIDAIQWQIDDSREGRMLRIPHSDHHIEILREIDDKPTESSHFLRFTEPVDGLERQYAAIAFDLKPLANGGTSEVQNAFAERYRIVPADRGCVAVYFTAAKETSNLRFHVHAPFVPELSRSSVKDTPANDPLFRQLAGLGAQSLSAIRDLGLLDRDFLAVLPNSQDDIPAQYAPIRNAIVDAMKECPLTPMQRGGHAPARQLFQAEAGLKILLDRDDIRFLTDGEDDSCDWVIAATQRNNEVDLFLRDLEIEHWGVEQFVKELEDRFSNRYRYSTKTYTWKRGPDQPFLNWIRRKPAEWHRALYALFNREMEDDLHRFDDICIVRLSDKEYETGSECFFPTPETRQDSIHPRVVEATYSGGGTKTEQKDARSFLEGIGVREVEEFQQIEAILKRRYADQACGPSWKTHESDLKRFIALVDKDRTTSRIFQDYFILQRADGLWSQPGSLYLDTPFQDTGLHDYYNPQGSESSRAALSVSYRTFNGLEQLVPFARTCGVAYQLGIAEVSCYNNPEKAYLRSAPGTYPTPTGIDRDFAIPGLESLFERPTLALSRLVWNAVCNQQHNKNILRATFQYNQSNDKRDTDSQLVHQLRKAAWIPQGEDEFVCPAEALRDLLPDGFPFDPGWAWLSAISFGAETELRVEQLRKTQEIATELGFHDQAALADGRRFAELAPDTRQRILAEYQEPVYLPKRKPGNRYRRAELVRKEALKAPSRTTEKRERSELVNRDPIKREKTVPYLRDLYTNTDGVTICQVCKDRLPFKLAEGNYFFEAVEFIPDLKRLHHQNYLALCPNHAAMFMHANGSKDAMKDRFLALEGSEEGSKLELTLADQTKTIYFTASHIADIRVVIEVEDAK